MKITDVLVFNGVEDYKAKGTGKNCKLVKVLDSDNREYKQKLELKFEPKVGDLVYADFILGSKNDENGWHAYWFIKSLRPFEDPKA